MYTLDMSGGHSALICLLMRLKRLVWCVQYGRVARSKRACLLNFVLFRVTRIGLKTAQHIQIQVESLPKKSVTKCLTADYIQTYRIIIK
jgi:hypothetical protein